VECGAEHSVALKISVILGHTDKSSLIHLSNQ